MDRKLFYDVLRPKLGTVSQANVDGFERFLTEGERRGTPLGHLAYILAIVWWETGKTMQPVKEAYWLSEDWRRKNLRYFIWYGRGYIQLTWEENYRKASEVTSVDLIADPDAAMRPEVALLIAFHGMEHGWFTGKDLDDYIDLVDEPDAEDLREFANGRRIINGTDRQIEIGQLGLTFEAALKAGGYGQREVPAIPGIQPDTVPYHLDAIQTHVAALRDLHAA